MLFCHFGCRNRQTSYLGGVFCAFSAMSTAEKRCAICGIALFQIVLGLMCPGGLCRGGESQNGAKSRRFGMDLPSRAFYEGVNPKTILNNCHEDTKRHHNRAQTPLNCSRSTHLTPPAGFSWAKWLFRLPGPPKWQLRPPGQPNELFPTPYFDSQTETAAGHGVAADKLVVVVSEIERLGGDGQPAGAKIPVPS